MDWPPRLLCPWDSPGKNTGDGGALPCPPPGDLPGQQLEGLTRKTSGKREPTSVRCCSSHGAAGTSSWISLPHSGRLHPEYSRIPYTEQALGTIKGDGLRLDRLRLLIFLPAVLIPAWVSSSPAFHMLFSAYKLNKQGDNIHPWCSPFPIWNQSIFPCLFLTVASWPEYRFLRRQVRWSGIPRYADDTTLMVESEGELKNLLMKVKEESEKVGLICSIQYVCYIAIFKIFSNY